jgi:hypothetical protein
MADGKKKKGARQKVSKAASRSVRWQSVTCWRLVELGTQASSTQPTLLSMFAKQKPSVSIPEVLITTTKDEVIVLSSPDTDVEQALPGAVPASSSPPSESDVIIVSDGVSELANENESGAFEPSNFFADSEMMLDLSRYGPPLPSTTVSLLPHFLPRPLFQEGAAHP